MQAHYIIPTLRLCWYSNNNLIEILAMWISIDITDLNLTSTSRMKLWRHLDFHNTTFLPDFDSYSSLAVFLFGKHFPLNHSTKKRYPGSPSPSYVSIPAHQTSRDDTSINTPPHSRHHD